MKKIINVFLSLIVLVVLIGVKTEGAVQKLNDFESFDIIGADDPVQLIDTDEYGNRTYVVFVDDGIVSPKAYRTLSVFLMKLRTHDTVIFRVITPGGYVSTALMLYNDILKCKAKTIAEIQYAYSAGAIISMSCEEIRVNKFGRMLVHGFQLYGNVGGSVSEIVETMKDIKKQSDKIIKDVFKTFLTKKELNDVLNGKDLFLEEEEIIERIKKWKPINIKKRDVSEKAVKKNNALTPAEKEEMDKIMLELLKRMKKDKDKSDSQNNKKW